MTFQHQIVALLIGLFLAFGVGVYVGRGEHPASEIPSNVDVASAIMDAKNSHAEAQAYLGLLTRQTEALAVCVKQEAH